MGCAIEPAAKPNKEFGTSNQLLALNVSHPPPAVMFNAGYIFACATPTCALAATSAISLERTSGRRLTNDAGKPVEKFSVIENSFNAGLRATAPGSCPVKTCKAFSCIAILCSNCGTNKAVDCLCEAACSTAKVVTIPAFLNNCVATEKLSLNAKLLRAISNCLSSISKLK